jgi:hypothetical protein
MRNMIVTPEKTPSRDEVVVGQRYTLLTYHTVGVSEFGRRQVTGTVLFHDKDTDLVALLVKVPRVIPGKNGFYPIHDKTEGLQWHHREYLRTQQFAVPANGNKYCFSVSAHRFEKSGAPMMNSVEYEDFDTLAEAESAVPAFKERNPGLGVKVRNTETEESRWYYP